MEIVFLDTNIILDLIQRRENYILAGKIFQLASEGKYSIVTSSISMVNIAYILRKVFKGEELYRQLRLMRLQLNVISVSAAAYDKALSSNAKDFEDAVQLYSAEEYGADCVITRNKKDFIDNIVPIYTPDEFLDLQVFK